MASITTALDRTLHLVTLGGVREQRFREQDEIKAGELRVHVHGHFDGRIIGARADTSGSLRAHGLSIGDARPRDGEVGCTLSHVAVWREVATQPKDTWHLVCEDDARVCVSFVSKLEDIVATLHPASCSGVGFVYLYRSNTVLYSGVARRDEAAEPTRTALHGI